MALIIVIMILGALILSREASHNQTIVEIPNILKTAPKDAVTQNKGI